MNLATAIQSVDMDDIIDRMNAYAISRLRSVGAKDFNGKEPIDFVGDLLLKVMEGKRDWSKAQCSFKEFLFGCLKSEISNFFRAHQSIYTDQLPLDLSDENSEVTERRTHAIALLRREGADNDELAVLECWLDGVTKPSDIASELETEVKHIYNVIKRLERRLRKTQEKAKKIV